MNIKTITIKFCALISVVLLSAHVKSATQLDELSTLDKFKFFPESASVRLQKVSTTLERATQNNKLALVALGAQWCHDSRALSAQFSTAEMQHLLNKEYEFAAIDVGFLEDRRTITQMFGYPHYFATPTVLVIDPISRSLVNMKTLSTWSNAASVEPKDFLRIFADIRAMMANGGEQAPNELLSHFEQAQSERLQNAYNYLSPLLKKDEEKTLKNPDTFYQQWYEVKAFRTQLQKDIHLLRSKRPETITEKILEDFTQAAGFWER